ncbi:hypothetical protein IQ283_08830 (plasmid) [Alkalihalobacillus hwajinpoensis]|uniref:ATP-binding protein n=1 Tax=Guptibacillus hwajinpoensis TaxID=208199 RepID=UPI001883CC03|nr:hypothetical protein [Pseudalkalibacillus hwajinpoensis]
MYRWSGQTIPREAKEKIFERLYRVDSSRGRGYSGGTGLGLAISKEIIEHNKGEIGVKLEGNCHTFTFSLPVCK